MVHEYVSCSDDISPGAFGIRDSKFHIVCSKKIPGGGLTDPQIMMVIRGA